MILKNALIYDENFDPLRADLEIAGDRIGRIAPGLTGEHGIDLTGCTVVPGFVDIHTHGCAGADTCDGTREAVAKMAGCLARYGVTSFCPTTMTVPQERLRAALSAVKSCMEDPPRGAAVLGVNMEGPYISARRKGAQAEEDIRTPEIGEFEALFRECGGIIKIVDIAPENDAAGEFIFRASQLCRVSLAHSDADYEQAKASFRQGVSQVTHLFNAMTGFQHRAPGAVGAVFDDGRVKAEIICDGFHIHPAVLRTAFRLLGEERTIVVSDSMRAAGLPDGVSDLGGQTVYVEGGRARLADGTIAGSTTNLYQEFRNLLEFGIPMRQALRSVTINPAVQVGEGERIGSIRTGKRADLVVLGKDLELVMVIAGGDTVPLRASGTHGFGGIEK